MPVFTGSGVIVSFTPNLPADLLIATYQGLAGILEVGELQTSPGGGGKEYTEVPHDSLNNRETQQLLGNFTRTPLTLTVGNDNDDSASNQEAFAALVGVSAGFSLRVQFSQEAREHWCQCRMTAAGEPDVQGANAVTTRAYTVRPFTDWTKGALV